MSPIFGIDKCCFCCDHLKGVNALGWVYLVLNILALIWFIVSLSIVGLILRILVIVACALLIYGTMKKKKKFLIPFIVCMVIDFLASLGFAIYLIVSVPLQGAIIGTLILYLIQGEQCNS